VPSTITIGIDPYIELGPVTLAWHGLTITLGILVAGWLASRCLREWELDVEEVYPLVAVTAFAGVVGARAYFLLENEPSALGTPSEWLGTNGFSFYGAILTGVPAVALYVRRRELTVRYLDSLAAGFPLGMAVGRIGDVINGEHYGPPSDLPWAVRNSHRDADVPSSEIAYHSGGLYEVALGLAMFAVIWPLRNRLRAPGALLCAVVGLYAAGRFAMFFARSDSDELLLGLNGAQWTSVGLLAVAAALGFATTRRASSGAP
jgi:phosphatidylglycerol---prolipoprotein diacylglyceryl transferase